MSKALLYWYRIWLSCPTDPRFEDSMKTAEEVAKDIVIKLDKGFFPFNMEQKERADLIALALTAYADEARIQQMKIDSAYAEERVKEAMVCANGVAHGRVAISYCVDCHAKEIKNSHEYARAEALEEAANIGEDEVCECSIDSCLCLPRVISKIRALVNKK